MATLAQIEANRRNALKSTGPKTPEGKAAVSLNSLRHGLRARTVVLPGENRHEFHRLCDDLEAEWQPQTRSEQFYVEQMAVSQWKLTRMEVGEADIFRKADGAGTQIPLLDRLWQCQCRLERSYARAQRELARLQNSRPFQIQQPADAAPAPQPVAQIPPAVSIAAPQSQAAQNAPCSFSTAPAPPAEQPAQWLPHAAPHSDTALPHIESDRRAASGSGFHAPPEENPGP